MTRRSMKNEKYENVNSIEAQQHAIRKMFIAWAILSYFLSSKEFSNRSGTGVCAKSNLAIPPK
jgi:hypothetical protein